MTQENFQIESFYINMLWKTEVSVSNCNLKLWSLTSLGLEYSMGMCQCSNHVILKAQRSAPTFENVFPLTSTMPNSTPSLSTLQITSDQIQRKFVRFRVLLVGRANSGKTTILRRLCNTTKEPTIFNPDGKKVKYMMKKVYRRWHLWSQVNSSTLDPSMEVSDASCTRLRMFNQSIPHTVAWRA